VVIVYDYFCESDGMRTLIANICPDLRSRHFETEPLTPSPSRTISSIPWALATLDHPSSSKAYISSSPVVVLFNSGRLLLLGLVAVGILSRRLLSGGSTAATTLSATVSSVDFAGDPDPTEEASSTGGETIGGDKLSVDNFILSRSFPGGRNEGDPGAFDIVAGGSNEY
jgi:hypothetical protein